MLFSKLVIAQNDNTTPLLNENNLVFTVSGTQNPMGVSGNIPNVEGFNDKSFQTSITYLYRFDRRFSGEIGIGFGIVHQGFKASFLQKDYDLLKFDITDNGLNYPVNYFFMPSKLTYNKALDQKNEIYCSVGLNLTKYLDDATNYSSSIQDENNKYVPLIQATSQAPKETKLNPTLGLGYQRNTKRGNSLRMGIEYQFPMAKNETNFSILQPDRTYRNGQYYYRGDMLKVSLSYVISNKKEVKIVQKRDFKTAKHDFFVFYEIEQSGTYRTTNDPKKNLKAPLKTQQDGMRFGVEYMLNDKWSAEFGVRSSQYLECYNFNGQSQGCYGGGNIKSFSLNTHYYLPVSNRVFLNFGGGFSWFNERQGAYNSSGSITTPSKNSSNSATTANGNFATLDLSQSVEFSIFRAMRLYLKAQYAQGFTKAYTHDFASNLNGEINTFTGFSRGSYLGLRAGVKFNFGYLRS